MRRAVWLGLLLCVVAGATGLGAQPQEQDDKRVVLLLPVAIRGDYQPLEAGQFMTVVDAQVEKLAPDARLVLGRDADLRGLGWPGGDQPPAPDLTRKLCTAYGCNRACWVSVRFNPELNSESSVLALGAAARLWAFNPNNSQVTIDEPVSVVRTAQVAGDAAAQQKTEDTLANRCVQDLARQMVTLAQQRAAQARSRAWSNRRQAAAPTTDPALKAMAACVQAYASAVDRGDLISATDAQTVALGQWRSLSQAQKTQMEQAYPGTYQWMESGAAYDIGGVYWSPYRFGGGRR